MFRSRWIPPQLLNVRDRFRLWNAERAVDRFAGVSAKNHDLPGELIVSITSYPPRFGTLHKTLKSILSQTIRPDRTVLWIAHADMAVLPHQVRQLEKFGLEIRPCPDLKSYKKSIPSLRLWPEAFLVTADDDFYYRPNWLETLVKGVIPGEKVIICRRAHLPQHTASGFAPYDEWHWDFVSDGEIRPDLFPTTGAGVLYPPHSLPAQTLNEETFLHLCPTADDIWMFWMGRLAGARYRQVGGGFAQVSWGGSQSQTLASVNCDGGNDEQLRAVAQRFEVN